MRLAAFGDMALSGPKGALGTVAGMLKLHAQGNPATGAATADGGLDAVLHFGDLGYAEGSTVIWDVWHSYVEGATKRLPYLITQVYQYTLLTT